MSRVHSRDALIPGELVARLEVVRADHLRMASWNKSKDRPARVAFHHDAAQAIAAVLKATTASSLGASACASGPKHPAPTGSKP